MRSKEAIRKEIVHYINMLWGAKEMVLHNPLVDVLVEAVSHEIYLQESRLENADFAILGELVRNLAPANYKYIRPAHGLLYAKPNNPTYCMDKRTAFAVKQLPEYLSNRGVENVEFTSVADFVLADVRLTHIFHGSTLWQVDALGNKVFVGHSSAAISYDSVWVKLEIGPELMGLEHMVFYIDFPHLPDIHEYFELVSGIKWFSDTRLLQSVCGIPLKGQEMSELESDIAEFYAPHFQTLCERFSFTEMEQKHLPDALSVLFPPEFTVGINKGIWFELRFPFQYRTVDLEKLFVAVNVFPVMNKQYNEARIQSPGYGSAVFLTAGINEAFLEIDRVCDLRGKVFYHLQNNMEPVPGTFKLDIVSDRGGGDARVSYINMEVLLEKLIDMIDEERVAFPEIKREEVVSALEHVRDIQNDDYKRLEINRLVDSVNVAQLTVFPDENVDVIEVSYWTSFADVVDGILEGTPMMAKASELNKSEAVLISSVQGGRNFHDTESLKALNRFFMMSKGRILTRHNIVCFCNHEIGKYVEKVDVVRKTANSPKYGEGVVVVLEIQITPKQKYCDYFKRKGVLKDLLVRLRSRSPADYNYSIKVMER